ncbi:MotA/TolQ/ExbB proton channel family protein [Vibrio caribbeanicus]|uniref:MotA/TolQ/ExbB proton channel family protein n=1 Tax=Vibrio caribbeanicus TaxID=701175 RepID=UPI0030DDC3D4
MRFSTTVAMLVLSVLSSNAIASDLVSRASEESKKQKQHNIAREADFKQTEALLYSQKSELMAQKKELENETKRLSETFSENEDSLARLEEKLRLESGSLGELFGIVRLSAKELESELVRSVTGADSQSYNDVIKSVVSASKLPSIKQLKSLWAAFEEQIIASNEIKPIEISYINGKGQNEKVNAIRLGSFGLIGDTGYIKWDGVKRVGFDYSKQPDSSPTLTSITPILSGQVTPVTLDPSRGAILEQFTHQPTLLERFQTAGIVGKVIAGLLVIGLLIAVVRGTALLRVRHQIKKQLKTPGSPGNNPLGRVLSVYNKDKDRTVEALELRLLEAVVDEQSELEKGLSMLKLFAALAPMLGLLGTVTGMIETFQVITQFGNGDPKIMADGISMALVTTVLGLITAMPLLLAHNILSSQAETIRTILEKQGIALVAEQAESACSTSKTLGHAA